MLQDSPAANQFIDKIIEEKGLVDLDQKVHDQLHKDLLGRLETRINRAIVDSLDDKQVSQVNHLIDTKQVSKIQPFLQKEGINVNGIIASAMNDFYYSYLSA